MKTLLLLALAAAVIVLFLRRRSAARPESGTGLKKVPGKQAARQAAGPYRATVIVPGAMACDAAIALAQKPFLDADKSTPSLPLPNCTAPHCRCKYVHRDDRREEDIDRRFESGMQTEMYRTSGRPERRITRGRRKTDTRDT